MYDMFRLVGGSDLRTFSGTGDATVTVPAGFRLLYWYAIPATGTATEVAITPKGAGQKGTALDTVTLPAGSGWFGLPYLGQYAETTTIALSGSPASYVVGCFKP